MNLTLICDRDCLIDILGAQKNLLSWADLLYPSQLFVFLFCQIKIKSYFLLIRMRRIFLVFFFNHCQNILCIVVYGIHFFYHRPLTFQFYIYSLNDSLRHSELNTFPQQIVHSDKINEKRVLDPQFHATLKYVAKMLCLPKQ